MMQPIWRDADRNICMTRRYFDVLCREDFVKKELLEGVKQGLIKVYHGRGG